MRPQILAACLALAGLLPTSGAGPNSTHKVQNRWLTVSCDAPDYRFTLEQRGETSPVRAVGRLLDSPVQGVQVLSVQDPVFGKGRQIRVRYLQGGSSALELYPNLPFVLVRTEVSSGAASNGVLNRVLPAQFSVDLGKPSSSLRTLGTAGLTEPGKNPGSYLFLTVADPETRRGLVAGWLTQDRGSGVLFSTNVSGAIQLRAQIEYGRLPVEPGTSIPLETLAIGCFADARLGLESYAEALVRQYHVQLRPQIAGYCTWYSQPHGGAGDQTSIVQLAEVAARELKPFGFSFVQIDDKWQDGKERNGPARRFYRVKPDGPFKDGLQPVAERLHQLGLSTGLWFLPFASDYQDPEFKERQHWFVKRLDGTPYETPWGNTSLDLTHPEVKAYLGNLVKTIRSWGVNYFKMDGLWTGSATEQIYVNDGYRDDSIGNNAPFFDPKKTNIEAMRDGLKLLRQAAGPDIFFSGCNLSQNMRSLAGSIGLVDSMRIGPDNGQGWRDYREEISRNESGSIITGPVRGTRLYFLHGRLWWNDPDPCYVRPSVPSNHARLITSWVALSGQFNLNSDWIPGLPPERLEILKRTLPHHGAVARPVDYFDSIMPGTWLVTDTRQAVRRDVLGLFNWESQDRILSHEMSWAGLNSRTHYHGFDFWADTPVPEVCGRFSFSVPAQSCRVVALRAVEGHPILVSTSRHVTQGMVDVADERWRPRDRTLSATSQLVANDPYELRIAGLEAGNSRWRLQAAQVSPADQAAGVLIAPQPPRSSEPGWARVKLSSPSSRPVQWSLKFVRE